MPSERPETWSDWAHVERIAGAPMPAMPLTGVYFRVPHARETSSKVPASIPSTGGVHQAKGGSHWLLQWGSLSQGAEGGVAGSGNGSSGGFASGVLVRVARFSGRHGCSTSFWIGQRLDESDPGQTVRGLGGKGARSRSDATASREAGPHARPGRPVRRPRRRRGAS